MVPVDNRPLLSPAQVAAQLGVSIKLIYATIWRGELPASKVGRLLRIRPADVDALLARGRTATLSALIMDKQSREKIKVRMRRAWVSGSGRPLPSGPRPRPQPGANVQEKEA